MGGKCSVYIKALFGTHVRRGKKQCNTLRGTNVIFLQCCETFSNTKDKCKKCLVKGIKRQRKGIIVLTILRVKVKLDYFSLTV